MRIPEKDGLEALRLRYPKGAAVVLDFMDDPQAPPAGSRGIIRGVDDAGHILVRWEGGSGLSLIPGYDSFHLEGKEDS